MKIEINRKEIEFSEGMTILDIAYLAGIYIPALCSHPYISSDVIIEPSEKVYIGENIFVNKSHQEVRCNLCFVQIEGYKELQLACKTKALEGMKIQTESSAIKDARQHYLAKILSFHPHACLTCAQREGCSRTQCSSNVALEERCCWKFGNCELEKICDYIGIPAYTQSYKPPEKHFIYEDNLFLRDYSLCIGCKRCVAVCNEKRNIGALGYVIDDGRNIIGSKEKDFGKAYCRYCGGCVSVCPTGALKDKKDIGIEFKVPCEEACPIHLPIGEYIYAISKGEFKKAARTIQACTPLGRVLGYVCFHPCEEKCLRGYLNDEPIAICALKRFAMEYADDIIWAKEKETGKKIVVIGSGPAGLSAAYYLALMGHTVEIFEALPEPGGMLRYGIPDYRLPKEELKKDIEVIKRLGVKIYTSSPIKDITQFKKEYDAVLLAIGLQRAKRLNIEGVEHEGVLWGLDFLREVNEGAYPEMIGKRVIVIGGGNVAIDVALSALRLGAASVNVACLESYEEMPAYRWEIKEAEEEGVRIYNSYGPDKIIIEQEKIKGIELIKCISVYNERKEFAPAFDSGVRIKLEGDVIIFAIGQSSDADWLKENSLEIEKGNLIKLNSKNFQTNIEGVFACGDIISGPLSVVYAIASGKEAAQQIDKFLGGEGKVKDLIKKDVKDASLEKIEDFANLKRIDMPILNIKDRKTSFKLIELGYDKGLAIREAIRCLRCDLRADIPPSPRPPEFMFEMDKSNIENLPEAEGVVQLLDEKMNVIAISGSANIKKYLEEKLNSSTKAKFYIYELDPMYTKRESELLQEYLRKHGRLPEGEEDLF